MIALLAPSTQSQDAARTTTSAKTMGWKKNFSIVWPENPLSLELPHSVEYGLNVWTSLWYFLQNLHCVLNPIFKTTVEVWTVKMDGFEIGGRRRSDNYWDLWDTGSAMENEASPACNSTSEIVLKLGNCWVVRVNPWYAVYLFHHQRRGPVLHFLLIS